MKEIKDIRKKPYRCVGAVWDNQDNSYPKRYCICGHCGEKENKIDWKGGVDIANKDISIISGKMVVDAKDKWKNDFNELVRKNKMGGFGDEDWFCKKVWDLFADSLSQQRKDILEIIMREEQRYYIKKCQLEDALTAIKEGYEPCSDYYFACRNCQTTLLIQLLEEEIDTINWILNENKKEPEGEARQAVERKDTLKGKLRSMWKKRKS